MVLENSAVAPVWNIVHATVCPADYHDVEQLESIQPRQF
jgi:hypothetical protein